jgi:caa(3)-type oxidase subunit IV
MTAQTAHAHPPEQQGHDAHAGHHHTNYVKIWAILLVLLVISVLGPMLEIRLITLITAFGIALVKAAMVVRHFMHINLEKKYVGYLLTVMIVLMVLMVGGVGPDVLKHEGQNWTNVAAKQVVEHGMNAPPPEAHH